MGSFVRFIVFIVIVGIVLNLAIVLMANSRSQRQQKQDLDDAKARFHKLVEQIDGRYRRLDIVVESQRNDASANAIESTLLLRQYASTGRDQSVPLPVWRVVIPGDHVGVDGVILEFARPFAEDTDDFQMMFNGKLNTQLAYFGSIGGEEQASSRESAQHFTFLPQMMVPELTRIYPLDPQPTYYELRLWQYIWGLMGDPPRDFTGRPLVASQKGLTVTWTKPVTHSVGLQRLYSAFVYLDGTVTIEETSQPDVWSSIINEGKQLKDATDLTGNAAR